MDDFIEILYAETIHVVSFFILEIGGCRGVDCVGRRHSNVGHIKLAVVDDVVGLVDLLPRAEILKVAAKAFGIQRFHELYLAGDAVVKLVVAKGDIVITHFVHDVDDVAAVRGGTQASALDKVAIGDDGDILVRGFHLVLERREIGIAINTAVDIVFVKDNDVL